MTTYRIGRFTAEHGQQLAGTRADITEVDDDHQTRTVYHGAYVHGADPALPIPALLLTVTGHTVTDEGDGGRLLGSPSYPPRELYVPLTGIREVTALPEQERRWPGGVLDITGTVNEGADYDDI